MEKLKKSFFKYRWIILITEAVICGCVFAGIYFNQRGIWDISLTDADMTGGYTLEDGSIHIDETDGAYGLYLTVNTDEIEEGWYKVHVGYATGYDDNGFLIKPLNGNPNAVNKDIGDELEAIILKSHHEQKSVHVWVEEATGLQISFHFCGGSYLDIKSIELQRVANYTPAFLIVFLFIIVDILFWEALCVDRTEWKRRIFVRGSVAAIALAAGIPLMNRYVLMGNDLMFHLFRIEGIAEGLCSGQFPVRIMPQWWNEYGYGASMFYGDIFLYIPAIMLLLNYKIQTAFKSYIVLINLLTAWISYKSFLKIGKDEKIALFGAAIYSLNIFRLMSLYYNNGVGVYTAMAFLPLVLAGFYCIREERGWLYLALGLTGCIQSHLMTCEMVGIFIILFLVLGIKLVCQKSVFLNLCRAGAAVLLWNLWFLVPFLNIYSGEYKLKEMDNFQRDIQQYGLAPGGWIRTVIASLNGETSVQGLGIFIGLTSILGLIFVFVTLGINLRGSSREMKRIGAGTGLFGGASFAALFLCSKYFPYDFLCEKSKISATLIHSLQFPWRFLEVAIIFATAAIVLGFALWKKRGSKRVCIVMGGILGAVCLLETSFYYQRLLIESPQMTEISEYYAFPEFIGAVEYLPGAVETLYEKSQPVVSCDQVKIESYEKDYTTILMDCANDSGQEAYIDVPLFYYPCYKAKDADTGEKLMLAYGENAKIRMILPAGYQGKIKLEVSVRKLWKMADLISLISVLAAVIILTRGKNIRKDWRVSNEKNSRIL